MKTGYTCIITNKYFVFVWACRLISRFIRIRCISVKSNLRFSRQSLETVVFWDVTSCSLTADYHPFEGNCSFILQGGRNYSGMWSSVLSSYKRVREALCLHVQHITFALKMNAEDCSERLVISYLSELMSYSRRQAFISVCFQEDLLWRLGHSHFKI